MAARAAIHFSAAGVELYLVRCNGFSAPGCMAELFVRQGFVSIWPKTVGAMHVTTSQDSIVSRTAIASFSSMCLRSPRLASYAISVSEFDDRIDGTDAVRGRCREPANPRGV